jgi:hypothetical protein
MTSKTITTRISNLSAQDLNAVIDRLNGKDVELSPDAKKAHAGLQDIPTEEAQVLLDERWAAVQDEMAARFSEGTAVHFEIPKDRLSVADTQSLGVYVRDVKWPEGVDLLTIKGSVAGYCERSHRLVIECANGDEWAVTPVFVRAA